MVGRLFVPKCLMLSALGACAVDQDGSLTAAPPPPTLADRLAAWTGLSFSDVVTAWGLPAQQQTMPDGGLVVSFVHAKQEVGDGSLSRVLAAFGANEKWQATVNDEGQVREENCVVNFQFDAEHRVRAAAIVRDDGAIFSNCTGFVRQPPPGLAAPPDGVDEEAA